jgi:hypothetical protein
VRELEGARHLEEKVVPPRCCHHLDADGQAGDVVVVDGNGDRGLAGHTVNLVAVDACGDWPSVVGGGAQAF